MGKSFVIKNKDNGQKAYAKIIEYYFGGSSHACVAADKLRKAINDYGVPMQSLCGRDQKEYI